MKATAAIIALAACNVEGFLAPAVPSTSGSSAVTMSAAPQDRRSFAQSAAVAVAGFTAFTQGAAAAKYFGDKNDYPEVLKVTDAVKDTSAFSSTETKSAVDDIKAYQQAIKDLQASLAKDPQADLKAQLNKTFDYSKLRQSLNQASLSFEEDSQRGIDRVSRLILQYAVEFEEASKLKAGQPRNQRKLQTMTQKLDKLANSFEEMLKYL